MTSGEEIRTDRLVMRRARLDDVDSLHRIMSEPRAMRYWSTPPHAERAVTEAWLASMIALDPADGDDFILTLRGEVIGKLGSYSLPDVGFLIDPQQWGRGLASEALSAFVARRRALGSDRLVADVDPRNLASLRLLARHGFVETGRATGSWVVGGEVCDSIYLALPLG